MRFSVIGWVAVLAMNLAPTVTWAGAGRRARRQPPVGFSDAYQDGYVLTLWSHHSDAELAAILARIRETGARHLTIPYFGCQSTIHSSDVGACQVTDPNEPVREAKAAIAQGFSVSFLPIVTTPGWDWRGEFDPDDVDAWFASYKTWLRGLAQIANQLQLKELIVGSELSILYSQESQWEELLTEFHALFHGPLIVTVNWDSLDHGFWSYADAIGVSFYFPLSQNASPNAGDLASGMNAAKDQLLTLSRQYGRPIHITEFGYMSVNGAAAHPWAGSVSDGANPALQAQCFDAFRKAWGSERDLARADIWATSGALASGEPGDVADFATSFETLGKPAESVITQFFSERAKLARAAKTAKTR